MLRATSGLANGGMFNNPTFTGVAEFADGTAAAPSIAFTNATGTGFYKAGTDILGVATAGTACWQFNASGHLFAATDATFDIGSSGGNRPRNFFCTAVARFGMNTATAAGGSPGAFISMGTGGAAAIFWGSGAPTVSAVQGALYLRTDGSSSSTRLYVNTNGSTGWTNVTTAA